MPSRTTAAAALGALALTSACATPALASSNAQRRQAARVDAAVRQSRQAESTANRASVEAARVARGLTALETRSGILGTYLADLGGAVYQLSQGVQGLSSSVSSTASGLSALTSKVNDPNTGLGTSDRGIVNVLVQDSTMSSPTRLGLVSAGDIRQDGGDVPATVSGNVPYFCQNPPCDIAFKVGIVSNRPQPASGQIAGKAGGAVVIDYAGSSQSAPFGAGGVAEDLVYYGQTPGTNNTIDIPTRASNTCACQDITLPIGDPANGQPSGVPGNQVPPSGFSLRINTAGLYILRGTFNFFGDPTP